MIDSTIGYIHLNKFSGTTYEEFMKAMETLEQKGMKKLIFDLRGNGGGILTEATDIADEFLDDERLIVYTQGNKQEKIEYHCKRPGLFENGKLVLLVDETSASASEVVAGALQDWDRATIVGRRTFGKGLVQEQYDLSDGSALRLTVARYYTPIGRNIQKPYNKGRDAYNDELAERFENGELVNGDTVTKHTARHLKPRAVMLYMAVAVLHPMCLFRLIQLLSQVMYMCCSTTSCSANSFTHTISKTSLFDQFKDPADFARRYNDTRTAWNNLVSYAAKNSH